MEIVKQEGIKDCGVCSLLSVVRYYGGNASLEYLRELTHTTKDGVTALNLVHAARSLGFDAYGIKDDLENISPSDLPIISHIIVNKSLKHFVVIYKIDTKNKCILVMDPFYGKKVYSFESFKLIYSKVFIHLSPTRKILYLKDKKIIKPWLKEFLSSNSLFYLSLFVIIEFLLTLISSSTFNVFINESISYNIINNVNTIFILFLIIELFKNIASFIALTYQLKLTTNLNEFLTKKILSRITLLPYLYYENRTSGEIISKVKDLENIKNFLIKVIVNLPLDLMVILLVSMKLIKFSYNIAFAIFFIYILKILFQVLFLKIYKNIKNNLLLEEDKVNSILYENIRGMSTIKGMHVEKERLNIFLKVYRNFLSLSYKIIMYSEGKNKFDSFINSIAKLILISYGCIKIINGKINLSFLILIYTLYTYLENSFNDVNSCFTYYADYKVSKKRIEDLFMINIDNFNCSEYFDKYRLNGMIKIKNLNYSYGIKKIFNNLCLDIKKGEKIFLIGDSGEGKSTLMKILSGFIDIPPGQIKINNMDLAYIHKDIIRSKVSYTSQKEALFTGSIKDNIVYKGVQDLDTITDIVSLDKIYKSDLKIDEMIEEDGENLSGGERQRIILARSLMKKSDIYIFDEAFNELDINEEKKILTKVLNYLKDKTVIVISHRLDASSLFDRVITLKEGKIYEKL